VSHAGSSPLPTKIFVSVSAILPSEVDIVIGSLFTYK
jgi:hypothetical protein